MSYQHFNLASFFTAKCVAVIGASREPAKVGNQIFRNLLINEKLQVIPVNPKARSILNHPCVASITHIEQHVDLAVIVVPAPYVPQVIDECIEKKVKGIVLITAGFAETSKGGAKLQQEITTKLEDAGIALLGPNTLGFVYPSKGLNASFASQQIEPGSLALISQSGAMLTALFDEMESRKVGCSFAVSLGNKGGITENECLEYALNDPHTKTIGLYLESFANLPEFFALTSKISKRKPVIVLKGGRSKQGHSASVSHTAALATNYELLKTAQTQMGFVLVDTIEEFSQTLFFVEQQKALPENVMIMTNAGGPGVNTTDLVAQHQVNLAKWSSYSVDHITQHFPNLKPSNPFDLLGDARTDRFQLAVDQAQRDQNIDAIVVIITQQAVTDMSSIVEMLIHHKGKKPILVSLIGGTRLEKLRQKLRAHNILCTNYPNTLINILSLVHKVSAAQYSPTIFRQFPANHQPPTTNRLSIDHAFTLLSDYGFQVPRYAIAHSPQDIKHFVYPLYAKTANLTIKHKKRVGAVAGMVGNDQEAKKAYKTLAKFGNTVLYQELVHNNGELLLGAHRDDQFGWYVAFGLGGSQTDLVQDRAYVFLPATVEHIEAKFKTTKAYQLIKSLEEQNGEKGSVRQFIQCVKNLQQLIKDHPHLKEIEINPLMVNPHGFWAADIKIA